MKLVNTQTGEIIEVTPQRLLELRQALRHIRKPAVANTMRPGRTYHVRRLGWTAWWNQLAEHVGPVGIGLVVVWALLNLGGTR